MLTLPKMLHVYELRLEDGVSGCTSDMAVSLGRVVIAIAADQLRSP